MECDTDDDRALKHVLVLLYEDNKMDVLKVLINKSIIINSLNCKTSLETVNNHRLFMMFPAGDPRDGLHVSFVIIT